MPQISSLEMIKNVFVKQAKMGIKDIYLPLYLVIYIFMFMLPTAFMFDYVQQKQKIIMSKKAKSCVGTDGKNS